MSAGCSPVSSGSRVATSSRAIPAAFGVSGYYCRYEHHYVYWRWLADGAVGIVTILHERMHQLDRFREDDEA